MASYGRNFDFRIPPDADDRKGRFVLTSAGGTIATATGTGVPLGAPVVYDSVTAAPTGFPGANNITLATGAQAPVVGLSGILVYEHAPAAFAGYDPLLTLYSDLGFAPVGKLVQVVSGAPEVKVLLHNTTLTTFLQTTSYAARKMVAGIGQATPSIVVGDLLTPGTGNDTAGYWAETGTASQGWLKVVAVDNTRAEVEAHILF